MAAHGPDKRRHHWGMVIDLDRCNGCGACETACAAENNIPIVGAAQAAQGRAMAWLRVERIWEGSYPNVKMRFMPVMCQHCEAAPCEPVCPVYATYHTADGLNAMVYARCIGTRYCANNCPYTVRTFNWFDPDWPEPLNEQLNPDVSVRSDGVIEKCSFCVQRIRTAQQEADMQGRPLADGDVQPACAQSCATRAIVFGDLDDPTSQVSQLSKSPRATTLLPETGAKPKVVYLKEKDRL